MRAMAKKKPKAQSGTIAQNRRAKFDYHISDKLEAGISLQGWEVKSAREGKVQLTDTYVDFHNDEAVLLNAHFNPLNTVSTHFVVEPNRVRKLLMHRKEIQRFRDAAQQKGYTIVCTAMYWKAHLIKVEIGLAKGKQMHDKRETQKDRDWDRQKQRLVRETN